ncbi:MAG: efflux RND transporter periplasmic adaptor subunit [Acidobacteriota bacterium]|nr:efflux RND transporter periplasmic adaptor subunit [Acidobacteriota bacterium]
MRRNTQLLAVLILEIIIFVAGCARKGKSDFAAEAPPQAQISQQPDLNVVKIDRPERFTLVTTGSRQDLPELNATGVVSPDIERSIPVISLASGRVVEIDAKLGDDVKKGQLLLKILSNDISNAFQAYNQAKADEALSHKQLERAQLLYSHGAISLNDLQVAEDTEEKARVAMNSAAQQLRTLGGDINHESPIVNVYAPTSGTIVEQNVSKEGGVHTPDNQPSLFTIADLSRVWVICDVYENDLPMVRVGDRADVRLTAYPDSTFRGRISNVGKVLDPNLRTAKVRIELNNPGFMRAGMFVTATFYGLHGKTYAAVPAGAVLHLHDRDWVFVPAGSGTFRRTEVTGGKVTGGLQEIVSGLHPGQQVVNDPLALDSESQQ